MPFNKEDAKKKLQEADKKEKQKLEDKRLLLLDQTIQVIKQEFSSSTLCTKFLQLFLIESAAMSRS